ncbi:hypothetical protein F511_44694 [Dorcoceras hygrometricum]|uniref:Uncharacterized protein n=1 Tax=Dorcoceras hygrometricum TaxID=472368 RepID=A0A2Z7D7W9_9LAMI|nr:hypothetical protein F511_44694 [Dorcoceras hygrometricum]
MGGLSRNGCAVDGRGVRAGRASRLDASRLLRAQTVAQVAGPCSAAGSLLADRCRCLDAPLDRCWSTPVAQRCARWPALVAAACALAAHEKFEVAAAAPVKLRRCRDG